MEENDLRNNPIFEGWERNTFVDVEVIFCDKVKWQGVFENIDIANEQINYIRIPYVQKIIERIEKEYGENCEIYTTEQKGVGEYFWYNERRNVVRTEFEVSSKNDYIKCYVNGRQMAYEIRYMFLRDMPYKRLGDNCLIFLHSTNGNDASKMFGDCKNVFKICGFDDKIVEEYWKTHKDENLV